VDFFVDIGCPDDSVRDLVDAALFALPTLGTVIDDKVCPVSVRAYFETAADRDAALHSLRTIEGVAVSSGEASSTDWLEHYEQSLQAIRIGSRFIVAPDERLIDDPERIAIIIPQEQAFGTGSHATTALCLAAMENIPVAGMMALDVGTGTGILAIGLAALGARRVFAFDNDFDTFEVLNRNLERNRSISSAVQPFFGTLDAVAGKFQVMTVNILAEVIIELLPALSERLAPEGHLILSGVILERSEEVMHAAEVVRLQRVSTSQQGEWWCGVYRQVSRPANGEART